MAINWNRWVKIYEFTVDDPSIEYKDPDIRNWTEERDPRFSNISLEIQQRSSPRIGPFELANITKWLIGTDILKGHVMDNNTSTVKRQTEIAFSQCSNPAERIEELIALKGVSVQVASAVLTVYNPGRFAVIDHRVLRGLAAIRPSLTDPANYSRYAGFIQSLIDYNQNPQTYQFYMDEVRQIANAENLQPREVNMALWAFDRDNV